MRIPKALLHVIGLGSLAAAVVAADTAQTGTNTAPWLSKPFSLEECLNVALTQNGEIVKSQKELEAAYGVVIQTRAIAIPKVRFSGEYTHTDDDALESVDFPSIPGLPAFNGISPGNDFWSGNVRLVQSIFEGGRIHAALRSATLTKEQALWRHQAVVADIALEVRLGFYNTLLAVQQIVVSEASVRLLEKELEDTNRRFAAGTVPKFNVLRAEVELANAQPDLIRARNAHRITKNLLVNLMGYHVPTDVFEDIPLVLNGTLEVEPLDISLQQALAMALERRPELTALQKGELLRKEAIKSARAGQYPSVQGYVGYGSRAPTMADDFTRDISGWQAGVVVSWDIFDGMYTRGKVREARANYERAVEEKDDTSRKIELEVRSSFSTLIEAKEVLRSQVKVLEQADEALRLARARADAGTGTQLDVLSAQTALTASRTTQIRAQREYAAAKARLERAMGSWVPEKAKP